MTKQIKLNDNVLTVLEVYPYMYQNGKEVIRIKISESNHTYSDVEALRTNTDSIEYLEDDVKKNEYSGYTEDFKTTFYGGVWQIELTRKTAEQIRLDEHEQALIELAELVGGVE